MTAAGEAERNRLPLFVAAVVAMAAVVGLELGSGFLASGGTELLTEADCDAVSDVGCELVTGSVEEPPGRATRYLVLIDGLLLYSLALMLASVVIPRDFHGRAQGAVSMLVSILWVLLSLLWLLVALIELIVMVSLFSAAPFGTIVYMALWGFFPRGQAAAVLGLVAFFKIAAVVLLGLAQPRFLRQKGLMITFGISAVMQAVLLFLHGFFPRPVVAMADTFWAIVLAVVGVVWAVVILVGNVPAVFRAIRSTGSLGADV